MCTSLPSIVTTMPSVDTKIGVTMWLGGSRATCTSGSMCYDSQSAQCELPKKRWRDDPDAFRKGSQEVAMYQDLCKEWGDLCSVVELYRHHHYHSQSVIVKHRFLLLHAIHSGLVPILSGQQVLYRLKKKSMNPTKNDYAVPENLIRHCLPSQSYPIPCHIEIIQSWLKFIVLFEPVIYISFSQQG